MTTSTLPLYRHVVDCYDDASDDAAAIPVISPATNTPALLYVPTSAAALQHALRAARRISSDPYDGCLSSPPSEGNNDSESDPYRDSAWWSDPSQSARRASVLSSIASLLRSSTDSLADLEVSQIGRPRKEMRFQLSRLPEWFEYYASLLRVRGETVTPFGGAHLNVVRRVPLGVVAQIVPFNHPLLIAAKKLAPALAAGNCVVLKPSEAAPASVVELARLCGEAGLPRGVLSVVLGGREVGERLVSAGEVSKVDFTGGPAAGRTIAASAGRNMCGMTQELGGKAPMIVFGPPGRRAARDVLDEYLDPIVNGCAFGAFIASGQTCIAATRILVQEDVYDVFCEKLVEKTKVFRMGDPVSMDTTLGPIINKTQLDFIHDTVTGVMEKDGDKLQLLCGGRRYQGFAGEEAHLNDGNWYEPTVIAARSSLLDGPSSGQDDDPLLRLHRLSDLFQVELFGPVVGVVPFRDEAHAVALANDSKFSLGCSIWTHDLVQAHSVSDRIRAGIVWINDHHKNHPSSPWGGLTKESCVGRENGLDAYLDYSQSKSVVINTRKFSTDWFQDPKARYN